MLSWQRAIFLTSAAVVEATPAALLLTVAGTNAWVLLVSVVLLGAVVARLLESRMPESLQLPILLVIGLVLGLWVLKSVASTDYSPIGGWNILPSVIASGSILALLGTIYNFWRGTRLLNQDRVTISRLFSRSLIALIFTILLAALASALDSAINTAVSLQLLAFFAAGLLAVALANMADEPTMRQLEWRGVATLAAAIGAVLLIALMVVAIFGGNIVSGLFQVLLAIIVIIASPILLLAFWLVQQFSLSLSNSAMNDMAAAMEARAQAVRDLQAQNSGGSPLWLIILLQGLCVVVPILLLLGLYLISRWRKHNQEINNETRESVLSWGQLTNDLRGLFGGAGRKHEASLKAALAALRGNDPVSRVRRSYIRMLLAAEARDRKRHASQTPHEFAPGATSALAGTSSAVTILTTAYERARYAPETATDEHATQAEQAWKTLDPDRR